MRDKPVFLASAANAALALVQLLLFLPDVASGRALDAGLYRIDGLGLVIGVTFCLGASLTPWLIEGRLAWLSLLMSAAALNMAYAREPLLFYAGGELLWIALWLAARLRSGKRLAVLAWTLHLAGWPFLTAALLGLVPAFAPPFAGEAQPWPLWLCVILGTTALMRGAVWPFNGWAGQLKSATAGQISPLLTLYTYLPLLLLAKALVSAPWDPLGSWVLVLLGTIGLLGTLWHLVASPREGYCLSAASISAALIGFGLASESAFAGLGAVSLMLVGLIGGSHCAVGKLNRVAWLVALLPGLWLITQAALSQNYLFTAVLLLPSLFLAALYPDPTASSPHTTLVRVAPIASLLVLAAVYPQALYSLALQPAVGAMAGGVPAPLQLSIDWGVGLRAEQAGGVLVAALPLTGTVAALFLVWATLYWLRRIASRLIHNDTERTVEHRAR